MSTVNVVPDATVEASTGTLTGQPTSLLCLNDSNTATYVTLWPEAGRVRLSMTAPTKPANSVTKQVRVYGALSSASVNTTKYDLWLENTSGTTLTSLMGQQISGTGVVTYFTPWYQPGNLTAAQIGDLIGGVRRSLTGAVTNLRATGMSMDVVFALQPSVTVSQSVSGTSSTVTWVHTAGQDGGPQRWWHAYLTNSAGSIVYGSGTVDGPGTTSATATGLATGTYTWNVATAQEPIPGYAHWSAYAAVPTTIPVLTRAQVLSVVTTPQAPYALVQVTANRDTAQDAWDTVDMERLHVDGSELPASTGNVETGVAGVATGWEIGSVGTVSGTSQSIQAGGESGNFQRFTATLTGSASRPVHVVQSYACQPGDTVYVQMRVKTSAVTGTALVRLGIDLNAGPPSTAPRAALQVVYFDASPGGAWTTQRVTALVPDGVLSWRPVVELTNYSGSGAGTIDFDLVDAFVSSAGWLPLRNVAAPAANSITVNDYEAPPNVPLRYRARAVKTAGPTTGDWVYATTTSWAMTSRMLIRSTANPLAELTVRLASPPSRDRDRREVLLNVLGSSLAVTRYDVLGASTGELVVLTETDAEAAAIEDIVEAGVATIFAAPPYRWPGGYYHLGSLKEVHLSRALAIGFRHWRIPFIQVERPA